jgi:hypothetical protein
MFFAEKRELFTDAGRVRLHAASRAAILNGIHAHDFFVKAARYADAPVTLLG